MAGRKPGRGLRKRNPERVLPSIVGSLKFNVREELGKQGVVEEVIEHALTELGRRIKQEGFEPIYQDSDIKIDFKNEHSRKRHVLNLQIMRGAVHFDYATTGDGSRNLRISNRDPNR